MSTFAVLPKRVVIGPHPAADRLEIAKIDGYQCVVKKGEFATGDLALYIPEAAIIPETLQAELGVVGYLAGSNHDRVKAVRLRTVLSQGILCRLAGLELAEGHDYASELGITKYIPMIPIHLSGAVTSCDGIPSYTEIEDVKKYHNALVDGEEVVATEKLHGTQTIFFFADGNLHVSSKGFAKQGLQLVDELDELGRSKNTYWRAAHQHQIEAKLRRLAKSQNVNHLTLFGETIGVQDLKYGLSQGAVDFRGFDLALDNRYLDYDEMLAALAEFEIPAVPEIYRGPYTYTALTAVALGQETFTGQALHIREGVVVRPTQERYLYDLGRVVLKFLSPDYLLRKNPEATEFE